MQLESRPLNASSLRASLESSSLPENSVLNTKSSVGLSYNELIIPKTKKYTEAINPSGEIYPPNKDLADLLSLLEVKE